MTKKNATLPPVMPSAALERAYAKQLRAMVKEMQKSVLYWTLAAYKKAPVIATDAKYRKETIMQRRRRQRRENTLKKIRTAPETLGADIDKLMERWERKWEEFALDVAKKYVEATDGQARRAMQQAFKDFGFTIDMKRTPELKAVIDANVLQQVSLIRSIPQQYRLAISGMVQRSYMNNMDVKQLTKDIKALGHSTDRRAYLIAKDQTAKMTDTISRTHCQSLGITEGIWMHRAGGSKTFRQSHVKMNGQRFNLAEGCYDPEQRRKVHPGELPFCKCTYKPVLPFAANENTKELTA